ncbi:MAG: amidohydrolase family protein [Terracidiphilus sp.]
MRRRDVLKLAAYSAGALAAAKSHAAPLPGPSALPRIDAHIHLFDPSRPGGVPWPEKTDTALYKPALPDRYVALSAPFGVVGAIAVEASPLATDNDWLLGVAEKHPVMVGVIGDLVPGTPTYRAELDRLHANPLFRGFRYGNLWNRDLAADMSRPGFVEGLKALAQADLVFESANPDPRLIRAILNASQVVPSLRIVVDHLPNAQVPVEQAAQHEYWTNLHRLGENPNIFVKLSEIPVVRDGRLVTDPAFYHDRLDALWEIFGEHRVLFGSDWPNSDHVAPFAATLNIVQEYIGQKSQRAAEQYYWKNSIAAYKWSPRRSDQPHL